MMHTVVITGEYRPIEIGRRPLERKADVWLRRNPTPLPGGGTAAEEILLTFPLDMVPEEFDIDACFEADARQEATIEDLVEAMNILAEIVLGEGE